MIKKIILGAGTALSALLPIVSVVSCGDMNDYSKTKHNKFWSGDKEDNDNYKILSGRFNGKYYSKVMPLNEFLSDMEEIKIYDEIGKKWTEENIKKELKDINDIDFDDKEKVKKALVYSELIELDKVYYPWKDKKKFKSKDFSDLDQQKKKKKVTEAWDESNTDNKYSDATHKFDIEIIKYEGVLFWFRKGKDNLKKKIIFAKDIDSTMKLSSLINNIFLDKDDLFENQKLIAEIETTEYTMI